jgi:pSer/pThr/pTyr-binding forkhead associated (FHA) protein
MKAKLIVLRGHPRGKALPLPHGEFVIGRGSECYLRPNSYFVSRQHCLLRVSDRGVLIRDLGSTNGTLINGARVVGERALRHHDLIQIGPLVFALHVEDKVPIETEGCLSATP